MFFGGNPVLFASHSFHEAIFGTILHRSDQAYRYSSDENAMMVIIDLVDHLLARYDGGHCIWLVVWNMFYFSIYWE
jgi:hypothetical protein